MKITDDVTRLEELRARDILTESEFEALKSELLEERQRSAASASQPEKGKRRGARRYALTALALVALAVAAFASGLGFESRLEREPEEAGRVAGPTEPRPREAEVAAPDNEKDREALEAARQKAKVAAQRVTRSPQAARTQAEQQQRACARRFGPFVAKLEQIEAGLDKGLDYYEYRRLVSEARGRYDGIQVDTVGPECVSRVGAVSKKALDRYVRARKTWAGCLNSPSCALSSIVPEMRRDWRRAEGLIGRARNALRGLSP